MKFVNFPPVLGRELHFISGWEKRSKWCLETCLTFHEQDWRWFPLMTQDVLWKTLMFPLLSNSIIHRDCIPPGSFVVFHPRRPQNVAGTVRYTYHASLFASGKGVCAQDDDTHPYSLQSSLTLVMRERFLHFRTAHLNFNCYTRVGVLTSSSNSGTMRKECSVKV